MVVRWPLQLLGGEAPLRVAPRVGQSQAAPFECARRAGFTPRAAFGLWRGPFEARVKLSLVKLW